MKRVELEAMAAAELERQQLYSYRFLCCCSTPCLSSGAEIVYAVLREEIARHSLDAVIEVVRTGCMGPCSRGPLVTVLDRRGEETVFERTTPETVRGMVRRLSRQEYRPNASPAPQDHDGRGYRIGSGKARRALPIPELAEIIASDDVSAVVFVDSREEESELPDPGLRVRRVATGDSTCRTFGHHMTPALLMLYVQYLYGQEPPARIVTVPGLAFNHGKGLSAIAANAIETLSKGFLCPGGTSEGGADTKRPHGSR
jgi:(2Fe-2S) ferredoxin